MRKSSSPSRAAAVSGPPHAADEPRLRSLDSLRGLAALWVVLHHSWASSAAALAAAPALRFTPLRLLVGARPAVIFFFVLSGFVLALPYFRGRRPGYLPFVVQRVCRIYLPFAVSVLLSAAGAFFLVKGPIADATPFFNEIWQASSPGLLGLHLLMSGIIGQTDLLKPMWSLVQEIRVSLAFPALVAFVVVVGWKGAGALVSGLFGVSWFALYLLGQDDVGFYAAVSPVASVLLTLFFLFPFVVGIALARHREDLSAAMRARGVVTKGMLWITAAAILCLPSFSAGLDALYSLGAGLLIILVLGSSVAERILDVSPLQWLGRVSYSLYLIHLPILAIGVHLLHAHAPTIWIVAAMPLAALFAAAAMHRLVEAPSLALGRSLAKTAQEKPRQRENGTTTSIEAFVRQTDFPKRASREPSSAGLPQGTKSARVTIAPHSSSLAADNVNQAG